MPRRLGFALIVAVGLGLACSSSEPEPPAPSAPEEPVATPAPAEPSGRGGHRGGKAKRGGKARGGAQDPAREALCDQACDKMESCGLEPHAMCMRECREPDAPPDADLQAVIDSSCETLGGGGGGGTDDGFGDGSGCRARGTQDCPFLKTCCAGSGGEPAPGTPGTCTDISMCNWPTGG